MSIRLSTSSRVHALVVDARSLYCDSEQRSFMDDSYFMRYEELITTFMRYELIARHVVNGKNVEFKFRGIRTSPLTDLAEGKQNVELLGPAIDSNFVQCEVRQVEPYARVTAFKTEDGWVLRSDADETSLNNIDNLPEY